MFNLVDPPMRGMRYTAFLMVFLVLGTNGWDRYLYNASCLGSAKLDGSPLSWYVLDSPYRFSFSFSGDQEANLVGFDSAKSWGKTLVHVEPLEFPANQTGFLPPLPYRSAPHWRNGVSCPVS